MVQSLGKKNKKYKPAGGTRPAFNSESGGGIARLALSCISGQVSCDMS